MARRYGLTYSVSEQQRRYYRSILVNIPLANAGLSYDTASEASWTLPLPATFLVRQDGSVGFAEAYADFHVRPEPVDLMAVL